ncbi:MAG: GTPase Der [Gemmatimonadota bacterium]|nr:MAG: GTPase Der [Gemmatimonadota bacterium]
MRSSDGLPTVAIVGRPNVGKSTLFNRLVGQKLAVVHDEAGVTRDRNYARTEWNGRKLWLVDTGGFTLWDGTGIELQIQEQVDLAIEEADLILLLLDASVGLAPEDEEVIRVLLRKRKPVIVAANKADDSAKMLQAASIVAGGFGGVHPIAATSGRGIGDLLDVLVQSLPPEEAPLDHPDDEELVRVAILGRPNVGKSSIVNAILGEKQMVVSEIAGTTRDSVDTPLELDGRRYLLIDTAGLRRKARVKDGVEYWSTIRSERAMRRCDVAVVVLDATLKISEQDVKIAAEAVAEFKSVIVVANKWDAAERDHDAALRFEDRMSWHFKFLPDAPLFYMSALTGRRIDRLLPEAARLADIRRRRIPTAEVNSVLRRIVSAHPPPSARSTRHTRILYGSQVATRPPTFAVFTNRPENVEGSYERFLRNRFKEEFKFEGAHLKIVIRKRSGREGDVGE